MRNLRRILRLSGKLTPAHPSERSSEEAEIARRKLIEDLSRRARSEDKKEAK